MGAGSFGDLCLFIGASLRGFDRPRLLSFWREFRPIHVRSDGTGAAGGWPRYPVCGSGTAVNLESRWRY